MLSIPHVAVRESVLLSLLYLILHHGMCDRSYTCADSTSDATSKSRTVGAIYVLAHCRTHAYFHSSDIILTDSWDYFEVLDQCGFPIADS